MSSLLSVLLVSSSSSGSRLLFAYPPNAVATPRVQRPLYGKTAAVRDVQERTGTLNQARFDTTSDDEDDNEKDRDGEDMFGSRFIRGESSSSSSSEEEGDEDDGYVHDEYATREQREKETYKSHLGINTSVLGTLLCPSKDLCNKRFEMVINHLAFVSHPASKRTNHPPPASRTERSSRKDAASETPFDSDGEEEEELHNEESLSAVERNFRRRRPRNLRNSFGAGRPASGFSSRRTSASMPSRPRAIKTSRESSATRATPSSSNPANFSLPSSSSSASASEPPSSQFSGSTRTSSKGQPIHANQVHLSGSTALTPPGTSSASASTSASFATPGPTPTSISQPLPNTATSSSKLPESDLDVWSVVLVIDSPPDQHLTSHLSVYYRDVVVPLMAGLKYEERRDQYVTREAEKIALMRERAEETGMPLTPHIEELCRGSGLCAQLAAVYHGLKDSGMANLTFNDDIDMTVLLHHELFEQSRYHVSKSSSSKNHNNHNRSLLAGGSLRRRQVPTAYDHYNSGLNRLDTNRLMMDGGVMEGNQMDIDILPWQTLLPLQDPDELLKEVDDDGLLTRFLEIMSPTLTFTEYETLLDTDGHSIIEIAEHLIYWRKAKLVDAISLKCIYVPMRPALPGQMKLLADWTREFGVRFPELPILPSLLAILSNPQPFEGIIASDTQLRSLYLEALIWLLQQDLVTQLRVYMNLVATPEIKRAAYEREESKQKRHHTSEEEGSNPDDEEEDDTTHGEGDSGRDEEGNAGHSGFSGSSSRGRDEKKSNSNITLSSNSSSREGANSWSLEGAEAEATTRSPLPSSFPQNYPYVSAASAYAAARPRKSGLHGNGSGSHNETGTTRNRKKATSRARKLFLAAMNAPSIIANPSEPSSEEELWIEEIRRQVGEEKGRNSIQAFDRMLPYLDGSHHLDEILYRANLSRKVVRSVLADFEGFLVSFIT